MLDIRFSRSPLFDRALTYLVNLADYLPLVPSIAVNRIPQPEISQAEQQTPRGARLAFRGYLQTQFQAYEPGKTLHWVAEANRGLTRALRNAKRLITPTLLFVAQRDEVVEAKGALKLANSCQGPCSLVTIRRSQHSIHEEGDIPRSIFIRKVAEELGLPGLNNPNLCENLLLENQSGGTGSVSALHVP